MIEELAATARQVGLELRDMSDTFASNTQTWSDVLDGNPDNVAKINQTLQSVLQTLKQSLAVGA